jgi:hypothetical protein
MSNNMGIKTHEEMQHLSYSQYRQYLAARKTMIRNSVISAEKYAVKYTPNPDFDDSLDWMLA